jgi:hypothetical protein
MQGTAPAMVQEFIDTVGELSIQLMGVRINYVLNVD